MGEQTVLPQLLGQLEKRTGTPYPGVLARIDAGELSALRDRYLAGLRLPADTPFFTDKLPANFWLVGLIRLMFPTARLVNARRNPADTGLSCFKHLFGERQKFAYDATEIRQYIELHRDLMAFWHMRLPDAMHDLRYENLVRNPQGTISAMLEYCELPWQPGCLEFHKTRRAVRSSSAAQVRQPLHGDAVNLWKNYERHLQEFAHL